MFSQINSNTPLAALTVGQLLDVISKSESYPKPVINNDLPPKQYAYGLKGIRDLFGVSHATAHRYAHTILKDAVLQNGRKIVVDVDKAMGLFNKREE